MFGEGRDDLGDFDGRYGAGGAEQEVFLVVVGVI